MLALLDGIFTVNKVCEEMEMLTYEAAGELLRNTDLFEVRKDIEYEVVDGDFVSVKGMVVLKGAPNGVCPLKFKIMRGSFGVFPEANLRSFDGLPLHVSGTLDLEECENLTSLSQLPTQYVGGSLNLQHCRLSDLKGLPRMGRTARFMKKNMLRVQMNPLTSIEGIETFDGEGICLTYTKDLPLMRLMALSNQNPNVAVILVKTGSYSENNIAPESAEIGRLIRSHLDLYRTSKNQAIMKLQRAMVNAGLEGNALW